MIDMSYYFFLTTCNMIITIIQSVDAIYALIYYIVYTLIRCRLMICTHFLNCWQELANLLDNNYMWKADLFMLVYNSRSCLKKIIHQQTGSF